MATLWELLVAGAAGGLFVKLLDIIHHELGIFRGQRQKTRQLLDTHLDPILKAADELVGKIRALASRDFDEYKAIASKPSWTFIEDRSPGGLLFLLAVFWSRLELLRQESVFVELLRDEQGRQLKAFIDCLESKKIRLVDRATQRTIGELLIDTRTGRMRVGPFFRLARLHAVKSDVKAWLDIAWNALKNMHADKGARQRLLVYGTVLQAMVDTLDSRHVSTKPRFPFVNKLSQKSRRDLKMRVFKVHLPFVVEPVKYYGEDS